MRKKEREQAKRELIATTAGAYAMLKEKDKLFILGYMAGIATERANRAQSA